MDIRSPNLEPARGGKPRPPVMVPAGATNLLALLQSRQHRNRHEPLYRDRSLRPCSGNRSAEGRSAGAAADSAPEADL